MHVVLRLKSPLRRPCSCVPLAIVAAMGSAPICTKQHEANRDGHTSRGQPSNPPLEHPPSDLALHPPIKALGLRPRPPSQLRCVSPPTLQGTATRREALTLLYTLQPRPLVYPPLQEASSGGYPRPPPQQPKHTSCEICSVPIFRNRNP